MNTYIATFFSHFGAIRFTKELRKCGFTGTTMPVPRNLSSSCGTCVRYMANEYLPVPVTEEMEKIVKVLPDGYEEMFQAENS